MISEWRKLWNSYSPTSDIFPFGFMQLSTNHANDHSPGFPMVRWHQTADIGNVPNELMPVSLEFYSRVTNIQDDLNIILLGEIRLHLYHPRVTSIKVSTGCFSSFS